MRKILLVDYIGYSDKSGVPTGHSNKVMQELINMLCEGFEVQIAAPEQNILQLTNAEVFYQVPYQEGTISSKYRRVWLQLRTIRKLFKYTEEVWFVNTNRWVFFMLALCKKPRCRRIYITNYLDFYHETTSKAGLMWRRIYNKAMKKVDAVFMTDVTVHKDKHYYIPDYWFDEKYESYSTLQKKNAVYMCGCMNEGKEIERAIKAFKSNGLPLVIKGNFFSDTFYQKCKSVASENIDITSIRMEEKEYYRQLGSHKFVLLPYKKSSYNHRSSGVILESVFLNNVVIAPNFMLEQLGIKGIGYEDIDELRSLDLNSYDDEYIEDILRQNTKIKIKYSYKSVRSTYMKALQL